MIAAPALRGKLVDRLTPALAPLKTQVSYGWPKDFDRKTVVVNGPDPEDTEWAALGANSPLDDFFTIPLLTQVRPLGRDARYSDELASGILEVLYNVVREGKRFDGVLIEPITPKLGTWVNFPVPEGFVTQVELNLRCHARS